MASLAPSRAKAELAASLPDDWGIATVRELAILSSGTTPLRSSVDRYFRSGIVNWVKTGDLTNGVVRQTGELITATAVEECNCTVYPPDTVLVAMYGGFRQIGRTGRLAVPAAVNQALCAVQLATKLVAPGFLQLWLNHRVRYWRRYAASSRKDPNITRSDVAAFLVALPPKEEQVALTRLMAQWQTAIDQLSEFIARKRELKRGLMQQLLTGKRRFPEFTEPWQEGRLRHLFQERRETGREDLPLLAITNDRGVIPRDQIDRRDSSNPDKSAYKRVAPGDIGYNTMRMWQGVSALSRLEGIVSPAYTICAPKGRIDGRFAAHLFKLPEVVHLFYRYSQGLVDDTLQLRYGNFATIKVTIPGLDEQRRIAAVLDAADREIELLRRERELLKKQKRGLMQKLLTGQIRVKV